MADLYNRKYSFTFGDSSSAKKVEGLNVGFEVVHDVPANNTARFIVTNLSEDTRRKLSERGSDLPLRVLFEVGYGDQMAQLFLGRVRRADSQKQGAEWYTKFECGDGDAEIRKANVSISYPKGSNLTDVVSGLIKETGLDQGNIVQKIKEKGFSGVLDQFARGLTVNGNADKAIKRLAKSVGMTVTIQDGKYTAFESKTGGNNTGFVVSPSSGLLDSPELGDKGSIKARSLLLPTVRPGDRIKLESQNYNGIYRVQRATHGGEWRGPDWTTTLELRAVN